jgi:hypothetical protein
MIKLLPWLLCLTLSVPAAMSFEVQVELQPFASQVRRLLETLDYRSRWIALRILPSSHTNPVFVFARRGKARNGV